MAAIEEVLVSQLKNIAPIYPLNAPENHVAPYIIYEQSGGSEYEGLTEYTGTMRAEYELNILHETYKQMKSLTKLIVDKLKTLQGNTFSGILVQGLSFNEGAAELYEPEVDLYRKIINITITY